VDLSLHIFGKFFSGSQSNQEKSLWNSDLQNFLRTIHWLSELLPMFCWISYLDLKALPCKCDHLRIWATYITVSKQGWSYHKMHWCNADVTPWSTGICVRFNPLDLRSQLSNTIHYFPVSSSPGFQVPIWFRVRRKMISDNFFSFCDLFQDYPHNVTPL
jgi:hypothetical protein